VILEEERPWLTFIEKLRIFVSILKHIDKVLTLEDDQLERTICAHKLLNSFKSFHELCVH
jgi:hypothetical protein